jgi:hypothetical protein
MAEENGSPDYTPEQIVTLKTSVISKLAEFGVRKLTLHYSGSGDEGFIDSIEFEPDGVVIPPELKEQISDLAHEFLYAEHGSWGDGDGATGTVVIDPIEGKIVNEQPTLTAWHGKCVLLRPQVQYHGCIPSRTETSQPV